MPRPLAAMRYFGGKSSRAPNGTGRWIASQLPQETECLYLEPCSGMCGVLLQRPPSDVEIVNDANHLLVNWWRVVRERPAELARRLEWTPYSRAEYRRCAQALETVVEGYPGAEDDPLELARLVTVVVTQGMSAGVFTKNGGWRRLTGRAKNEAAYVGLVGRLERLRARMAHVQLECRDACEVLESLEHHPELVAYVDPPYSGCDHRAYGPFRLDRDRLAKTLLRQRGRVAVSGYGREWDHLGWRRETKDVWCAINHRRQASSKRTEVLWMNYEPVVGGQMDLFGEARPPGSAERAAA